MNTKRIITIFVVLIIAVAAFLILSPRFGKKPPETISTPSPSVEEQLEQKLKGLVIPDDTDKTELKNVSGGEGMGIATSTEVVADLPGLTAGQTYQVLLGNGTKTVLLGTMIQAKGGWMLSYDLSKHSGFNQIFIVRDSERILEGTFQ